MFQAIVVVKVFARTRNTYKDLKQSKIKAEWEQIGKQSKIKAEWERIGQAHYVPDFRRQECSVRTAQAHPPRILLMMPPVNIHIQE